MDWALLIPFFSVIVMIIVSAFFSAGETSFTASSPARMHTAEKEGDKRAKLVNRILQKKEKMIGAMLLGNNLVNIAASALATGVLIEIFGDHGILYATGIMTVMVLVFAEVLPKTVAFQYAETVAKFLAPFVHIMMMILAPVIDVVAFIVRKTLWLAGIDMSTKKDGESLELLRGAIELHDSEEEEVDKQRTMLRSILELADVTVGEIMIHRQNVAMIDANDPMEKIIQDVLGSPYSRIPVWRQSPDHPIGLIHAKWLLREMQSIGKNVNAVNIETIASEPWFIPETTTLFDQLQAFRERGEHLAFVVDEYGSFEGIVTLEDILEEIVGEIDDEHDVKVPGVRPLSSGSYLVNGSVTIRDLNREFEWNMPDDQYSTLAGLVLYEARRIPDVGQNFIFHGFRFDILRRHRNQITLVRVTPPSEAEANQQES